MSTRWRLAVGAVVFSAASVWAQAPPKAWVDPSPHSSRFVIVDEGVRLELLDWGGRGQPVLLLAGSGNTAHVFDEFALKLTDCCHVYGLTRRGFGNSSRPPGGYDDQRLSDDVLRAIEAAGIAKPVLIGHSMAGHEMTTLARNHSNKVAGLVYLDALGDLEDDPARDSAFLEALSKVPQGVRGRSTCPPTDRSSFGAFRESLRCQRGFYVPEAELRQQHEDVKGTVGRPTAPDWVMQAIGNQQVYRRDYSNIRVPVLALLELSRTLTYQPKDEHERLAIEKSLSIGRTFLDRWIAKLTRHVPDARIVDVPDGDHYLWAKKERQVVDEIHAFIARLVQPAPAAFEVVSIRPNRSAESRPGMAVQPGGRISWTNVTLQGLIGTANQRIGFDAPDVIGGPDWIDRDRFDVIAHAPQGVSLTSPDGFPGPLFAMLRAMLADRFKLLVHPEMRERPVYELQFVRADRTLGPQLSRSRVDCAAQMRQTGAGGRYERLPNGQIPCVIGAQPGRLSSSGLTMAQLANILSGRVGREVVDRTGLDGPIDFALEFDPQPVEAPRIDEPRTDPLASDKPSIFSALREQLGLKLESARGQVEVLVVDRAERPTPD